jgi:hypothetical protein
LGHSVKNQELSGEHNIPVDIKCTEFTAVIRQLYLKENDGGPQSDGGKIIKKVKFKTDSSKTLYRQWQTLSLGFVRMRYVYISAIIFDSSET